MAKFYGKDSAYLLHKEHGYFFWALSLIMVPLFVVFILMQVLPPVAIIIVALVALGVLIVVIEPLLGWFRKRSDKFFRGRGGEDSVKKVLMQLSDDYTVFEDVTVGNHKGNIDFVVVGPTGLFVLEVKSHGGVLDYNGYALTINGRNFTDKNLLRQVHGEIWAMKEYLQRETGGVVFIHSALVFSNKYATVNFGLTPIQNVFVVQKDFLPHLLYTSREYIYHVKREKIEMALMKTVMR